MQNAREQNASQQGALRTKHDQKNEQIRLKPKENKARYDMFLLFYFWEVSVLKL